jgi:hypothetical protein
MIFINNKYTSIYNKIIDRAKNRILPKETYKELHHIIPKSLGGLDNKENLIFLTGREHLVCHLLLIRITESSNKAKMISAAWSMANLENNNQERIKLNSRQYAILREQFSKSHSLRMKENNPMHLSKVRQIHQESIIKRGKTSGMSGKKHSEKTINLIKERNKGQIVPKEKRMAASVFHSNRPKDLVEKYNRAHASTIKCEFCGKLANPGTYSRWHGQNCKLIR